MAYWTWFSPGKIESKLESKDEELLEFEFSTERQERFKNFEIKATCTIDPHDVEQLKERIGQLFQDFELLSPDFEFSVINITEM